MGAGPRSGWQMQLNFSANNEISTLGYRYDAAGNVLKKNLVASGHPVIVVWWTLKANP